MSHTGICNKCGKRKKMADFQLTCDECNEKWLSRFVRKVRVLQKSKEERINNGEKR